MPVSAGCYIPISLVDVLFKNSIPSANEPDKDLILVDIVQLQSIIKAQISGRMASSYISDVVNASVNVKKTV